MFGLMYFLADISSNKPVVVIFSILAILATIGIIFLLMRFEKKERRRYREEVANYIEGVESKREITAEVNSYISKATTTEFTVLLVEIDDFIQLVENIGKDESNNVVKAIATKITSILPVRVNMGRYATEKFIVFIRADYTREESTKLARQILEVVNQPIKLYGEATLQISASIGVVFYPQHGRSFKQLTESLELACYQAKKDGGNKYRIYTEENNASQNLEYYNQIKEGIRSHQFDLFFQPMIDGNREEIYAIEGLLRWNHPELGILSPYKFISIMEQTGDINWVGLWGMETLMKEAVRLKKKYNRDFKMSLNLSPKQLQSKTLPMDFQKLLKKYHIPGKQIILEIEEFAIFDRQEQIKENLSALHDIGFDIAVDGFGLDYRALKQLEKSSINVLKLDREYLRNNSDLQLKEKFIEILVDFANNHNLTLVCEGVENYDYLSRADAMGCKIYQGYYFAKPLDRNDLDDFISDRDWVRRLKEDVDKEKEQEKEFDKLASNKVVEDATFEPAEPVPFEGTPDEGAKEEAPTTESKEETSTDSAETSTDSAEEKPQN